MASKTEIMNSLETAQELGKAGFDQKQAEALAKCFHDLSVMVSRQIAELGAEIRAEMREQFAEIRKEIAENRKETDRKIEEYRKETDRKVEEISKGLRNAILTMIGAIVASIGIMVALVIHLN